MGRGSSIASSRSSRSASGPSPSSGEVVDIPGAGQVRFTGETRGYVTVKVDPAKLDRAFARNSIDYIGNQGKGGIDDRYKNFGSWFRGTGPNDRRGGTVETPIVSIPRKSDSVIFTNGRHRFAFLRDIGAKSIPIRVPTRQAGRFRKLFGAE